MNTQHTRPLRGRKALIAIAALSVTALLSACTTSVDDQTAEKNDAGLIPINVGIIPFAELAAFYIGIDQGFFEDEGLDVEVLQLNGGGAVITALSAGDLDFAYSNYVSVLQAASKGLPVSLIRENDRPGAQALYVMPDSGITSAKDLVGKRVAVNSLKNIMELTTRAALKNAGVDPDSVEYVEIPPAEMSAALDNNQVDAAWLVEPFVTLATENLGVQVAVEVFEGETADLPVAGWATTPAFAQENPDAVEAFVRALDKASALAAENPELVQEIIPTYSQITPELAARMSPINFVPKSDLSSLELLQDLMIEFGYYTEPVPLDSLIITTGD